MTDALAGYSTLALEHFKAPRNSGVFAVGTEGVLSGRAGSVKRGREVHVQLRLDTAGRVQECRYQVYGCPATVALCSLLSERLQGLTAAEARAFKALTLARELELPADKHDAALVAEDAVRAALAEYNMTSVPTTA
jgi:nitrogen fixation protein NifU and related proteins